MNLVVLDANIAIYAVLLCPQQGAALSLIEQCIQDETVIYVPHLWLAEVAIGIRKTALYSRIST